MHSEQEPHENIRKLFEEHVPEVASGTVQIKGVARELGQRTVVSVHSIDSSVDPVGACVGARAVRVKAMGQRLSGEKLDIVRWSDSVEEYLRNLLAPAVIKRMVLDESSRRATIYVPAEMRPLVNGFRGLRIELTKQLLGWRIEVRNV